MPLGTIVLPSVPKFSGQNSPADIVRTTSDWTKQAEQAVRKLEQAIREVEARVKVLETP